MIYIIDRFEGDFAVCENEHKELFNIPRNIIPANAREGDCLIEQEGIYIIDPKETEDRQTRIKRKMDNLFE